MTDPSVSDAMRWDWSRAIFDHVQLRVSDLEESKRFYATVLEPLGIPLMLETPEILQWANLAISKDGKPLTQNVHIAFLAPDREAVDAFHRAGVGAGYRDNGAPGLRSYGPPTMEYYAAFVLDPDGNNIEAVQRSVPAG